MCSNHTPCNWWNQKSSKENSRRWGIRNSSSWMWRNRWGYWKPSIFRSVKTNQSRRRLWKCNFCSCHISTIIRCSRWTKNKTNSAQCSRIKKNWYSARCLMYDVLCHYKIKQEIKFQCSQMSQTMMCFHVMM